MVATTVKETKTQNNNKKMNDNSNKKSVDSKKKKKKNFANKPIKHHKVSKLPQKSEDFSSNWKKLLSTLPKEPKKGPIRKRTISDTKSPPKKEVIKPKIWFDDVDEELLDPEDRPSRNTNGDKSAKTTPKLDDDDELVKTQSYSGLTKVIGMDCEMVGVGFDGTSSILARVSIVNHFGHEIYDKFVKPTEKVTDYRTHVSGIRPKDIHGEKAADFKTVQKEVSDILKDRILVGHSIKHDLKVLFLNHSRKMIRDTSSYKPFKKEFGGRTPSLKNLTAKLLGVSVQEGEHSSVQDARATVRLYTMYRKKWEKEIKEKRDEKIKKLTGNKKISESEKNKKTAKDVSKPQYVSSDSSEDE